MKQKLLRFLLPLTLLFACLGFAACGDGDLPTSLSAPQNLRAENGVLYWDGVENADGYFVYVNDTESTTTECRFEIAEFSEMKIYSVDVQAYNGSGICSPYASMTYAGTYALPTDGMKFNLNSDNTTFTAYLVADENGVCVVPATHEGLPVTGFSAGTKEKASQIKKLYLPKTVKDEFLENKKEFHALPNLTDIVLEEGNPRFISEGNCIIDKRENTLTVGCIGSVIPDYVTKIGWGAFRGRNLEEIVLSDGITEIDDGAFMNCAVLKKAVLPEHITNGELNQTFAGCKSLTEVNIPKNVQNLSFTFKSCIAFKSFTVPGHVKELCGAFAKCTSLKSVTLEEGVERLDAIFYGTGKQGAFHDCTSLTEVSLPSTMTDIGENTFAGCTSLMSLEIPDGSLIGGGAFMGCTSLRSLEIPEGTTIIGASVFAGCTSLKSLEIPKGVKFIERKAFEGCIALESLVLPDSILQINPYAFAGCASLQSLEIPEGTASIGASAFAGCASLQSLGLPMSLTKLESSIFENCTSLESISLPENIQEIEASAFRGCVALKSITLPEKITKIEPRTFEGCISLKTIRIPDSVNLIVGNAFSKAALESIVLPQNIRINSAAFVLCTLKEVYYCGTEEQWGNNDISKGDNGGLFSATRYYYSETEPTEQGNYWHYVDGVPTKWA